MPQPPTSPNPLAIERLAKYSQWVTWKRVWRGNEATKPPFTTTWHAASTTKPATWTSYDAARKVVPTPGHDRGVGFVFTAHDPFVGIDLDGCRDPQTGHIAEWAQRLIAALASYTEVSPSGTGVKILAEGSLPEAGRKRALPDVERVSFRAPAIEMYASTRYFTITNDHVAGTPETIEPRQAVLDAVFARYFADAPAVAEASDATTWATNDFTDDQVLELLFAMERGDEYRSLFEGDAEYGDDSAGDWRLACALAFVAGPDADQVERLLWRSGRVREKWHKHRTYLRKLTVERAIAHLEGGDGFYVGPGNSVPDFNVDGAHGQLTTEAEAAGVDGAEPPPEASTKTSETRRPAALDATERAAATADTFVDDYVQHEAERTDASSNFQEAAALLALSGTIGRKGSAELLQGEQHPMLNVTIIQESTRSRKSTVLNHCRWQLRELAMRDGLTHLAPDDFSPQRLVQALAELDGMPLVLIIDEFADFYDQLNKLEYHTGTKGLLCRVYDGTPLHRERVRTNKNSSVSQSSANGATFVDPDAGWKSVAEKPFLSQLHATTKARFSKVATEEDVLSGWLARYSFISVDLGKKRVRKPLQAMTATVQRERQRLLEFLVTLSKQRYAVTIAPEVMARFDHYANLLEDIADTYEFDEVRAVICGRHIWVAFHLAQLFTAADKQYVRAASATRPMTFPHLFRAIEIAERWRTSTLQVLGQLSSSVFERDSQRVLEYLRKQPNQEAARGEVSHALHLSKRVMTELQDTLLDRNQIAATRIRTTGGAPSWRLKLL